MPASNPLRRLAFSVTALIAVPVAAGAHPLGTAITPANGWSSWTFEPAVIALLMVSAAAYVTGVWHLRRQGSRTGGRAVVAFALGWIVVAVALVSPVDAIGSALFSMHMVQHELLMLVAAPLVALGEPVSVFLAALPSSVRQHVRARCSRVPRSVWALLAAPAFVWLLHAVAICAWHIPLLFDAAVESDVVHAAQHASFFGTALLFWWGLTRSRYGRHRFGAAVLYVFTTTIYTGAIGALLTVSPRVLYRVYAATPHAWGYTPLEDQQLGGLIMWVPASVIYTAVGLWLFAAWLRQSDDGADLAVAARASARAMLLVLAATTAMVLSGCGGDVYRAAAAMTGGDPARGRAAITKYGCDSCHTIPGIRTARGLVGPPLTQIGSRVYLAGHLPNTPDNMTMWIREPRHAEPKTAMPDTGVTEQDGRDIAAYLYTLR